MSKRGTAAFLQGGAAARKSVFSRTLPGTASSCLRDEASSIVRCIQKNAAERVSIETMLKTLKDSNDAVTKKIMDQVFSQESILEAVRCCIVELTLTPTKVFWYTVLVVSLLRFVAT